MTDSIINGAIVVGGAVLLLVWLYIAAKLITSGIIKARKQIEKEDSNDEQNERRG